MILDRINKYSGMMPKELMRLINGAPKNDLEWALIMYLFENTKKGNIITLGKLSNFFDMDDSILFNRLNNMRWWVTQYLNNGEYGGVYYTYEITEIAADFMIKLIELLDINKKEK
jgi:hypothetical protein